MLKLIIISLICGLSIGQIGNFKSVKDLMFFVVFVYSPVFHCIVVLIVFQWININYHDVTSARSCNKVGHLFWFTILAQHETNDVILYIHSVHKHRGNSFQRQNYKMRLKQKFELNKFHASKKDPFFVHIFKLTFLFVKFSFS
jgi:hypothetical protein